MLNTVTKGRDFHLQALPSECLRSDKYYIFSYCNSFLYMKEFTEQQVNDLIRLKYGRLVDSPSNTSYVSNRVLGKIFKVSSTKIH